MNGDSQSLKSDIVWVCPNPESHKCTTRLCEYKGRYSRQRVYQKRKSKHREYYKQRYQEVYKKDPQYKARAAARWKKYRLKKGKEWERERYQKYKKHYWELSESHRGKIRAGFKKWYQHHKRERMIYAREFRRRNPNFGIKALVAKSRRTGDFRELIERCHFELVRCHEASHSAKRDLGNSQCGLQLRETDSQATGVELQNLKGE